MRGVYPFVAPLPMVSSSVGLWFVTLGACHFGSGFVGQLISNIGQWAAGPAQNYIVQAGNQSVACPDCTCNCYPPGALIVTVCIIATLTTGIVSGLILASVPRFFNGYREERPRLDQRQLEDHKPKLAGSENEDRKKVVTWATNQDQGDEESSEEAGGDDGGAPHSAGAVRGVAISRLPGGFGL